MKYYILLLFAFLLTACVQTPTKKPLLGTQAINEKIGIVNLYVDEINTFHLGATVFQNKSIKRKPEGWNLSEYIRDNITKIFQQVNNTTIEEILISDSARNNLAFKSNKSLAKYEKRIQNIPEILNIARSKDINKIFLIAPSSIFIPETSISVRATGLWYSFTGAIFPYSTINLYVIDPSTNGILGLHDLSFMGELLKLENDLSQTEIDKITAEYEKEKYHNQEEGARNLISLNNRLGTACGNFKRYTDYDFNNKAVVKNSLLESIDKTLLKLESIYLGKDLNKKSIKDYFQVSGRNIRFSQSCEI